MKSLSPSTPSPSSSPTPWLSRSAEQILVAGAIAAFAAGVLLGLLPQTALAGVLVRWAGIALLVPVALGRRSLLGRTFLAMLAGAAIGAACPLLCLLPIIFRRLFFGFVPLPLVPVVLARIFTRV